MEEKGFIIEYLYRDAGNNKLYEEAIIDNPDKWDIKTFENWFKSQLIDGLWFNPLDFGLPKPTFPDYDGELDHEWCEFIEIRLKDT
jgi:hypothetical protein